MYQVTNKSAVDGVNVELAGRLAYLGPGEHLLADLGRLEADSFPESLLDVVEVAEIVLADGSTDWVSTTDPRVAAQEPTTDAQPPVVTTDAAEAPTITPARREAPAATEPVEPRSNIGS